MHTHTHTMYALWKEIQKYLRSWSNIIFAKYPLIILEKEHTQQLRTSFHQTTNNFHKMCSEAIFFRSSRGGYEGINPCPNLKIIIIFEKYLTHFSYLNFSLGFHIHFPSEKVLLLFSCYSEKKMGSLVCKLMAWKRADMCVIRRWMLRQSKKKETRASHQKGSSYRKKMKLMSLHLFILFSLVLHKRRCFIKSRTYLFVLYEKSFPFNKYHMSRRLVSFELSRTKMLLREFNVIHFAREQKGWRTKKCCHE